MTTQSSGPETTQSLLDSENGKSAADTNHTQQNLYVGADIGGSQVGGGANPLVEAANGGKNVG
jgi:hypothetical protein